MSTSSPCQCDLYNTKECDNELFLNENLSDLTINFPSHNISYYAHRLMMAKKSPYFKTLFYGPMAIKDTKWNVQDNDIEPEVFKILLAHLYNLNLLDDNLEMSLHVYKLADCYMIDSLKSQCLIHVRNIISKDIAFSEWNYHSILEWTNKYGFNDIKVEVLEGLSATLCKYDVLDFYCTDDPFQKLHGNFSNLLFDIPSDTRKELLNLCEHLNKLSFEESWRNPENPLSSDVLMSIFESASHIDKITKLKGCFSPQIFQKKILTDLRLSIIDKLHSDHLYEGFNHMIKDNRNPPQLCLHIPCNIMSTKDLSIWSSTEPFGLYLSNVDDQHLHWAISSTILIKPDTLYLPRCSLSINGFKTLIMGIVSPEFEHIKIDICSCYIKDENDEFEDWLSENYRFLPFNLYICRFEDDMFGW